MPSYKSFSFWKFQEYDDGLSTEFELRRVVKEGVDPAFDMLIIVLVK